MATEPVQDVAGRIDEVHLDGGVVLKIVQHCKENLPDLVTGQLLGLDVNTALEVTNCFPFPTRDDDDDDEGAEYQIEMMRSLREVNVDNNTVGWYQSTFLGTYLNESMIETQYNYQATISNCVVVVYDPLNFNEGSISLKAFRLTDTFMDLYKRKNFTPDSLSNAGMSFGEIFQEIPVVIRNSHLVNAFLWDWESDELNKREHHKQLSAPDFSRLELSLSSFLQKNVEFMMDYIDDWQHDQNRLSIVQKNRQRHLQQQNFYLQKKKNENTARRMAGEEEEAIDVSDHPLFQQLPNVPSRLKSLLIANQINQYSSQINQFAAQSFTKLFLFDGLVEKTEGAVAAASGATDS